MNKIICLFVLIILNLYSCNEQTRESYNVLHNSSNLETIHNTFEQWKNNVISDSSFLIVCPRFEDFEKMNEGRAEKLGHAYIFPKSFNISYGNLNDDDKIDALVSFTSYTCYSNYSGKSAPNSYNSSYYSLLISSTFDSYEISNNLKIDDIKKAVQNELNASRIEISLTEIKNIGIISGTCLIWNHFDDEDFLGLCCPNYLMFADVDLNHRKIYIYLNELGNKLEIIY